MSTVVIATDTASLEAEDRILARHQGYKAGLHGLGRVAPSRSDWPKRLTGDVDARVEQLTAAWEAGYDIGAAVARNITEPVRTVAAVRAAVRR